MNLESLYHKINRPDLLEAADIPALKELCTKYPYAQLFSVLYLKALAQNKALNFEDELQNHAYKITDRAKLHDLIHTSNQEEAIEIPAEQVSTQPVADQPFSPETPPVADQADENPIIGEAIQVQHVVSRQDENQEPEAKTPENIPVQGEEPAETPKRREIDELEKEILSGVMATAYSLELEEKQRADQQNETVKPEDIPAPAARDENPQTDINQSRSFTSWLKLASQAEETGLSETGNVLSRQEKIEKESDKIIEKFIREEPERFKPKTEFYSAPKKAKESISDDKLIYTETLANIYALQGNYPKAITAFQQLMLTIPEKKLYFAQKIEELNKKINS